MHKMVSEVSVEIFKSQLSSKTILVYEAQISYLNYVTFYCIYEL